jgi:hypothetical protein
MSKIDRLRQSSEVDTGFDSALGSIGSLSTVLAPFPLQRMRYLIQLAGAGAKGWSWSVYHRLLSGQQSTIGGVPLAELPCSRPLSSRQQRHCGWLESAEVEQVAVPWLLLAAEAVVSPTDASGPS